MIKLISAVARLTHKKVKEMVTCMVKKLNIIKKPLWANAQISSGVYPENRAAQLIDMKA